MEKEFSMTCPVCGEKLTQHPVDKARESDYLSCPNNCEGKRYLPKSDYSHSKT